MSMPPPGAGLNLYRTRSSTNSPVPGRNAPYSGNMSSLHQQMLTSDLQAAANRASLLNSVRAGHVRSDSNPLLQGRSNSYTGGHLAKKADDASRNGHSQKMVHTYATGKASPVGMRPGSAQGLVNKPPVYPTGSSVGLPVPPVAPSSALRSVASMSGSLSARAHPRRSSVGSPNVNTDLGDQHIPLNGARHARNNSTPGQIDGIMSALLLQQQQKQHQQQKQQAMLQQQVGEAHQQQQLLSAQMAMQKDLQQKQLMQELLLQSANNPSSSEIFGHLQPNTNITSLGTDAAAVAATLSSAMNYNAVPSQSMSQLPGQQSLPILPQPSTSTHPQPFVPSKLELYAALLGGSEVAERNLAAIPELEAQLFSAVTDLMYVLMLGESVEEVLTSITAIAQFTRNEQMALQTPMPVAFASWLRRVALVMPLITAVYQERSQKLTVREGCATLLRIFAQSYPRLSEELDSLMGMGEAAAACMLDASSLWRQVVALLEDKEDKLQQMEAHLFVPNA
eukprot:TRINITY_DN8915_c0_g1_i2.p1 TRINITY_DN8915_c0_g1~~TRINITY_DN8915_c0_g1_i2.p1  ORF type:complete len:579 (+),score=112.06 TRINITY_DN8915_c0_g1_i2:216-1739(+)